MKQQDEIEIGKLLGKFKFSENEKVFKVKQKKILAGKNLTGLQNLCFFTSLKLRSHQNYALLSPIAFF